MESESVQCCVTSPPYFGLRDYGTAEWDISNAEDAEIAEKCDHKGDERFYSMQGASSVTSEAFSEAGEANAERLKKARWREKGTCIHCGAVRVDAQIGLEATPAEFVAKMVEVFEEVRRVLKKDGTLWLNLGDSYAGSGRGRDADGSWNPGKGGSKQETNVGAISGRVVNPDSFSKKHIEAGAIGNAWVKPPPGLKQKDLIGIPWRVAFALQEAGWWLRQDIIWSKPNPMPESVTDRCTKSHEYIFLLTKSAKYFYDNEAIRESMADSSISRLSQDTASQTGSVRVPGKTNGNMKAVARKSDAIGMNGRNIQPTNSEAERRDQIGTFSNNPSLRPDIGRNKRSVWTVTTQPYSEAHFATFPPKLIEPCILAGSREGDTVLDPFNGSGTTGLVSLRHRRNYIGIELNPEYIEIAEKRLSDVQVKLF